jgi:hypothetical protein
MTPGGLWGVCCGSVGNRKLYRPLALFGRLYRQRYLSWRSVFNKHLDGLHGLVLDTLLEPKDLHTFGHWVNAIVLLLNSD